MKKKLAIIILCILMLTGCSKQEIFVKIGLSKNPITAEDFKKTVEKYGYEVQDESEKYTEPDHLKNVYIATNKNKEYTIEFGQFKNKASAELFFQHNREQIIIRKSNFSSITSVELKNYQAYSQDSGGSFMIVSQIGKTAMFAHADSQHKEEIVDIFFELGYIETFNSMLLKPVSIASLLLFIFFTICGWKLFTKANQKGWKVLIPFYNYYLASKIVIGNGWHILWFLVPKIYPFLLAYFVYRVARAYGKSIVFSIFTILLSPIFIPIVAFGKSEYIGLTDWLGRKKKKN